MIYLYRCPIHGEFEVSKSMSESSRVEHCFCGDKAERIFHPLNFTFGKGMWEWSDRLKDGTKVENGLGDEYVHNF